MAVNEIQKVFAAILRSILVAFAPAAHRCCLWFGVSESCRHGLVQRTLQENTEVSSGPIHDSLAFVHAMHMAKAKLSPRGEF